MNELETWRTLPGFEDCIEVSDQGRVRSLDRMMTVSESPKHVSYQRMHRGRILSQSYNDGYLTIALRGHEAARNSAKVHQLVLEAFIGPKPDGMECCHGNGKRDDNRLENLRWDTPEANVADRVDHGNGKRDQCPQGHEYTPENTKEVRHTRGHTYKRCVTCSKEWLRKTNKRRSADPAFVAAKKERDRLRHKRNLEQRRSA